MGNLKQRFGSLVVAHRRRHGWTQRQLAEAADLSDDMIARIEVATTGVSFDTIEKLAAALQVDPAELFTAQLPAGAFQQQPMTELVTTIAGLTNQEIVWLSDIVRAVLKPRQR
jgi:transcriptional regulator with XRE-family HTH domain